MANKLRIQVKENYTRDVFIDIEIESEKTSALDELLDKIEGSSANYETLLYDLENQGIKITNCDDNDSLFDFEDNSFIDYREIKEVDEREG